LINNTFSPPPAGIRPNETTDLLISCYYASAITRFDITLIDAHDTTDRANPSDRAVAVVLDYVPVVVAYQPAKIVSAGDPIGAVAANYSA